MSNIPAFDIPLADWVNQVFCGLIKTVPLLEPSRPSVPFDFSNVKDFNSFANAVLQAAAARAGKPVVKNEEIWTSIDDNNPKAHALYIPYNDVSLTSSAFTCSINHARAVLQREPHRRFLIGASFSQSVAKLWLCHHDYVLASHEFDYNEEVTDLQQVILSVACGDRKSLGFDETVEPILNDDGSVSYIFHLAGKWYRTICDPLYLSHRSRVYIVAETRDGSIIRQNPQRYVLKDSWAKNSEKDIQDDIKRTLQGLDDADGGDRARLIDDHFLTIHKEEVFNDNLADSDLFLSHLPPDSTPEIRSRRRLLAQEICSSLTSLSKLTDLLMCFKQLCAGLKLLHDAGYVHRDISIGNCLVYVQNDYIHAKLVDFEYCRPFNDYRGKDTFEGTLHFMAVEAIHRRIRFITKFTDIQTSYYYHPYHDYEGLYWVFLWCWLRCVPQAFKPHVGTVDSDERLRALFNELYPKRVYATHLEDRDLDLQQQAKLLFMAKQDFFANTIIECLRSRGWANLDVEKMVRPLIEVGGTIRLEFEELEQAPQNASDGKWPTSRFRPNIANAFTAALTSLGDYLSDKEENICFFV